MTVKYMTVPFKRWHLKWLTHADGPVKISEADLLLLEGKNSWTIVADDTPIACGGTMEQWLGRHVAWAYLHENSGSHMNYVTRQSREIVAGPTGRVEMTVRTDFLAGQRWAGMLGFKAESVMKQYGPEGEDHVGYVRFN